MPECAKLENAEPAAFDYELPEERIAQRPVYPYDSARMLVVDAARGNLIESTFAGLAGFLRAGDLLIFNDSQVLPARFVGALANSGAKVELLILARESGEPVWRAMGKPLKKIRGGSVVEFARGLRATVLERSGDYEIRVRFEAPGGAEPKALMEEVGLMPVPPYIRNGLSDERDRADYQSMFARVEGSIAAPTASLHFTPDLIGRLTAAGVEIATATLHVGAASFLAVIDQQTGHIRPPGAECYRMNRALLEKAAATRQNGGRVIAVGTTVVRALETMARSSGPDGELAQSSLFITPGFEFRVVDGIITNFHQPRTTHLMLVQAFLRSVRGEKLLARSYEYALEQGFRFLSYGDGMFLAPEERGFGHV